MSFDVNCHLWPNRDEVFFREREVMPLRQSGAHCVATVLAIITGAAPDDFHCAVNTQDPTSWSDAIKPWGMQLAYCPTDARKLRFYIPEMVQLDDLFVLSYYTGSDGNRILADPDVIGWVCASHVVVLHLDHILDPASGRVIQAGEHTCNDCHTKRIFRVVPAGYHRSL